MTWCNYRITKVNYLEKIISELVTFTSKLQDWSVYELSKPSRICDLELLSFEFLLGFLFVWSSSRTYLGRHVELTTFSIVNLLLLPIFLLHLHPLKSELMKICFFADLTPILCCVLRRELLVFLDWQRQITAYRKTAREAFVKQSKYMPAVENLYGQNSSRI